MKKGVIILCICSALFTMCNKPAEKDETVNFSGLYGKTSIFRIEEISNIPDVQFPDDQLDETFYSPVNEEIRYNVVFSENGDEITIETGNLHGRRIDFDDKYLKYEIDEGLFAGGRMLIWKNNNDFEAELTIYGSGVPVIKSERGILE